MHHRVSHVWRGGASSSNAATAHALRAPTLEGISEALRNVPKSQDAAYVYYATNGGLRHIHHFVPPRADDTEIVAEAWSADDITYRLLTKPLWVLRRAASLCINVAGDAKLEQWSAAHGFVIASTKALLALVERLPRILAERRGNSGEVPPVFYRRPTGSGATDVMGDVAFCLRSGEALEISIGDAPGYVAWPRCAPLPCARDLPLAPLALPTALPKSAEDAALAALAFAFHIPEATHTLPPSAHAAPFEAPEPEPILDELEAGFAELLQHQRGSCGGCSTRIEGQQLRCLNCPDWEACMQCEPTLGDVHPGHKFVPLNSAIENPFPEQWKEHPGVACTRCSRIIVGPRFKCTVCRDFDLCASCESLPTESHRDTHGPVHVFAKIDEPLDDLSWQKRASMSDPFAPKLDSPDPFSDPCTPEIPFMLRGLGDAASLANTTLQHPVVGRMAVFVQDTLRIAAAASGQHMPGAGAQQRSTESAPGPGPGSKIPLAQAIVQVVFASLPRSLGMFIDLDRLAASVAQVVHAATSGESSVVEMDAAEADTFVEAEEDVNMEQKNSTAMTITEARLPASAPLPVEDLD